jgi:hypothetical protein
MERSACRPPNLLPRTASPRHRAACALNGTACPVPAWAPQWNLTLSTVCQPSATGYFTPPASQPWGLISLDWSVAESIWKKPNQNDSTVEATSIEGCRMIKASEWRRRACVSMTEVQR